MAFRAFDEWQPAVAAEPQRVAATEQPPSSEEFTPLELSVIAVARLDGPASIDQGGRLSLLVERLFGIGRAKPLANPRLEELRRFAVLARTGRARQADTDRFLEAGFTRRAASLLLPASR